VSKAKKTRKTKFKFRSEVVPVVLITFAIIAYYGWYVFFHTVRISSCAPNTQIAIRNCNVVNTKRPDAIVQQCDFENVGNYPITVGYHPGKYYQKYWTYDSAEKLYNRGNFIPDLPDTLAPGRVVRANITYHPDVKKVIFCPLDPAKLSDDMSQGLFKLSN
jgi:hypothetical protein